MIRWRLLATSAVASAMMAAPSWAQDAAPQSASQSDPTDVATVPASAAPGTTTQDIVVTGTRASLSRALTLKRDANQIVDAISAEDLGKFPDKNVAESLQHVPGVAIDRTGDGEGRTVTVRGFGPQFNTVLLNNRLLATDQAQRSFSFDILAPDLITSAEVYKSANAVQQDGGIGSTIVLRTARPTDRTGVHGSFNIDGRIDSTDSHKVTPEISGLVSASNEDRTFGILASFNYSKRTDLINQVETGGWIPFSVGSLTASNVTGVPDGADTIYFPRTYGVGQTEYRRRRYGGTLAVDYAPSDHFKIELDALYSNIKTYSVLDEIGFWNSPDHDDNIEVDSLGTVTHFTVDDDGNLHSDLTHRQTPENRYTMQFGGNFKYDSLDGDTIALDISHSQARLGSTFTNDIPGLSNPGVTPAFDLNPGSVPTFTGYLPTDDTGRAYLHCCGAATNRVTDNIWEINIDGEHRPSGGLLESLKYGVLGMRREKNNVYYSTPNAIANFYSGYFVHAPADMFTKFSPGDIFGQSLTWLTFNHDSLMQAYGDPASVAAAVASGLRSEEAATEFTTVFDALSGDNTPIYNPGDSNSVRELTGAAYVQAQFKGDIGSTNWVGIIGGRYVYTDVTSNGFGVELTNLVADPAQPGRLTPTYSDPSPISIKSHYGYFLPSATFRWNLTSKFEALAAVSRTLTRPDPGQLSVGRSYGIDPPQPSVSGGNPYLKPIKAWNFDLGLNYYISRDSYLSIAGFYKSISDFISTGTVRQNLFGYDFLVTEPLNANKSKVYGFEATAQMSFDGILPAPLDGFGFSANYTKVNSTTSFDPSLSTQVFNVEGLSDTANAILFYEKGPVSIRAAYNWRAPFLQNTFGDNGLPTNVAAHNQIDLKASLQANEHVQIFADVENLTDEKEHVYSAYQERFTRLSETGRFISFGARYTF